MIFTGMTCFWYDHGRHGRWHFVCDGVDPQNVGAVAAWTQLSEFLEGWTTYSIPRTPNSKEYIP